MNKTDLVQYLKDLAARERSSGSALATVAAGLIEFVANMVAQGNTQVDHLTRMTDIDPAFDAESKAADAAAAEKFGGAK